MNYSFHLLNHLIHKKLIADLLNNKSLNLVVTESFIRGSKLNLSIAVITQSNFKLPKGVKLNLHILFIMEIPNKRELRQIALNHLSDIDVKVFMKIYKNVLNKRYSFLVNDTTLPSNNPLTFRKNLSK